MKRRAVARILGALLVFGARIAAAAPLLPAVPAPGVTPATVTVGSVLDLSGPLAAEGAAIRDGLTLAFAEANAKGGVLGRRIRLLVKDSAYDPRQARAGAEALLKQGIFAMIGADGTPPISAIEGPVLAHGTLELFPFLPSPAGPESTAALKFEIALPIPRQIAVGLDGLLDERGPLRTAVLYRDGPYGRAALDGAQHALARRGTAPVAAVAFAPGAKDVGAEIAELRRAGAELVVLGAVAQESFRIMAAAHAQHWYPVFLGPSDCYVPEAATLGGRAAEGLFAVATTPIPYPDTGSSAIDLWARGFERRFHTLASTTALRAYLDGRLFVEVLRRSGSHPTPLLFARRLEAMPPWRDPLYGGIAIDYTASDHMGLTTGFLAQFVRGRWHMTAATDP
ncbi:MAG: ABC transporter substrate-binding protein [Alphaproteobacteria bacterium]|nr:ABC transporter substrate-binding protein [Alphaproteobacteria bacterium]